MKSKMWTVSFTEQALRVIICTITPGLGGQMTILMRIIMMIPSRLITTRK